MLAIGLILITNIALCSTNKVENNKDIIDLTESFLDELNNLKINQGELYTNQVNSRFKSSYWVDITPEEIKGIDVEFSNMLFIALKELQGGRVLQSKKADKLACVFVYNKGVIGAFSLLYEDGWKFMSPSVYFAEQNIPKVCSALGFELGVRNDELIILDDTNYPSKD